MRVLVGCEESGVVRRAFRERGHDAWSCDLLPARDGSKFHIRDCITANLRDDWDIIILHPPCTALAVSGNRWYGEGMPRNREREFARLWTMRLFQKAVLYANKGVCLENPVGVLDLGVKPQYIQPWQFGHGETKKTGLWLAGLPPLIPTNIVDGREQRIWKMPPSATRQRDRSETYQGIAEAMADQWGIP